MGISEVLNSLASRLKRVDLRLIDEIRTLWPQVVDASLASSCTPLLIRDGVLIVAVPSGAYAQRVNEETPRILAGFGVLGARAPRGIRTRVQSA